MVVEEVWASGYRSIEEVRLPLGPVTVVVGPNGSGKTNLYRSLALLHSASLGTLSRTLVDEGGMPSVAWAGPRSVKERVRVAIGAQLTDLAYELAFGLVPPPQGPFALDPDVKDETLWVVSKGRRTVAAHRERTTATVRDAEGSRTVFPVKLWGGESLLAQLNEPQRFPLLSAMRSELSRWRFYHHFRTDPLSPARHEQVGTYTAALAHDGSDLAAALMTILHIGDGRRLQEAVGRAFPGSQLNVQGREGRFSFNLTMPGLHRPMTSAEVSDGTLRYLCLVAALLSPRPAPFLVLNEPETSLHPELIDALGELIAVASERSQIFLTTHSAPLAELLHERARAKRYSLTKREGATVIAE
jgi:predicted ATPase